MIDVARTITTGELARALDVPPGAVRKWARDGLITPALVTGGGHYRWDVDQVRAQLRDLNERRQREQDHQPDD